MTQNDPHTPSHAPPQLHLPPELAQEILRVMEISLREAGDLLREDLYLPAGPRAQNRHHAHADGEAEELIRAHLRAAFPTHDIVGEEGDGDRHDSPFQWQIDPNDGTSAYLRGFRGSSVSIGLLYQYEPIAGGVFAFAYPHDQGDLIIGGLPELFGGIRRNGVLCEPPLPVRDQAQAIIAISQGADDSSAANIKQLSPSRYLSVPSIAYRLALAAVDEVQAGVSINGPTTWDVAGGHALLRAHGRDLWVAPNQTFTYSRHGGGCQVCVGGDASTSARLLRLNLNAPRHQPDTHQTTYPLSAPRRVKSSKVSGDLLARAQGALIGSMAGDALGSLVEFRSSEWINSRYPDGVREMVDGGTFDKLSGQVTDDCEMAVALARSIIKRGEYEVGAAAVSYAHWRSSNPFDIGNTTRASLDPALRALSREATPAQVAEAAQQATLPESQANGALMRITPLAIWGAGQSLSDSDLADLARADASITHTHLVCRDANAVYVVAMRYALMSQRTAREVYDYALDWAQNHAVEPSVLERLILAESAPPTSGSGWVLNAFQAAFYALLHLPYQEGVSWSISIGSDTDTNAAITGGLLGALYGLEAIPLEWRRAVITSRPHRDLGRGRCIRPKWLWTCDALSLAEALLDPA